MKRVVLALGMGLVGAGLSAAEAEWPFFVIRQTGQSTDAFLAKTIEIHARHPGSCDEIWFCPGAMFYNDARNDRELTRVKKLRAACDAAGIRFSIQQGVTLGHGSPLVKQKVEGMQVASVATPGNARSFSDDAWMVGEDGKRLVWRRFCPSSPELWEATYQFAKRVMTTLHPDSYWPDDDLRLGFCTARGCFCPRCKGKRPEELLAHYLTAYRRAADEVQPSIRFGLQTVAPYAPDTVKDYRLMMEALSANGKYKVGIRPGHGAYTEANPRDFVSKTLGIAREAERCRDYGGLVGTVCYEEETYPRLTLHKSPAAIVTEGALALACGADTLSLYFLAGGERPCDDPVDYERFAACLSASRAYLERVAASTRRTRLGGVVAPLNYALAGIPVSVPESPVAVPWPKDVKQTEAAFPYTRDRRTLQDALDRVTGGCFPVRLDFNHALRVMPRIDAVGRVDSVTLLNCSIGETFPFEMRVRNPASSKAELMAPRTAASALEVVPKNREVVVKMPSIGPWGIVTVFFGS